MIPQARGNLELMMKRQLELRREETKTIHSKCDSMQAKLDELRSSLSLEQQDTLTSLGQKNAEINENDASVENQDVLRWAEAV